jgi:hypothetical protein
MVFIEVDSVMVLTSSVTTTSGMLSVLADTSVTVRYVTTELPGLLLVRTHLFIKNIYIKIERQK